MFDPNLLTALFIGRSGCGKGTQSGLLVKYLETGNRVLAPVLYIETGARFREFIQRDSFSSQLSQKIMATDDLQPSFLSTWMWANEFIEKMEEGQHLVIDGSPRKPAEALTMASALRFYGRHRPAVVHLNVSREWSHKHLLARGRADDDVAGIEKRLNWFDEEVVPAIEFFKHDPNFLFLDIDGERPIEVIHQDIIARL